MEVKRDRGRQLGFQGVCSLTKAALILHIPLQVIQLLNLLGWLFSLVLHTVDLVETSNSSFSPQWSYPLSSLFLPLLLLPSFQTNLGPRICHANTLQPSYILQIFQRSSWRGRERKQPSFHCQPKTLNFFDRELASGYCIKVTLPLSVSTQTKKKLGRYE